MLTSRPLPPVTAAPIGPASGDLGGSYPAPTVTSGANHTHTSGQITGTITPSSAAGGDLGGTFPNPTVTSGANHTHSATQLTGMPWSSVVTTTTVQTSDATETTLKSIPTTTNKGHALALIVSATQSDRSVQVAFEIRATVTNAGGTCTARDVVITPTDPASTWVATVDVSGADIRVRVTGAGGTTIDWCVAGTLLIHGS